MRAERPDVVIVATGGLPNHDFLGHDDLVIDAWDVMGGAVCTLGDQSSCTTTTAPSPGWTPPSLLAGRGAVLEFVTPERSLAPLVGSMNSPAYLSAFAEHDVTTTLGFRLVEVTADADGQGRIARLRSEYADIEVQRRVSHVVVEHGTLPNGSWLDLVPFSRNLGAVDHGQLLAVRPQTVRTNAEGEFEVYRIGDAVASRNIHAATYDALRLCSAI